tara:strand:- start:5898 stop:6899 length:1002 start_codon:yes stop_codon:yes gene_type:complete
MKIFKSLIAYFFIFLSIKIYFKKPKQSNVVIYGKDGSDLFYNNIKGLKAFIFNTGRESVNLYVLYQTILNNGFRNILKNYRKNFLKNYLKPKVIITFLDISPTFYLLKSDLHPLKFTTIVIQSSWRNETNYVGFNKKLLKLYYCDYFFYQSDANKNVIINKVNSRKIKFLRLGSYKNNCIKIIKTKSKNLKKRNVFYISQFKEKDLDPNSSIHRNIFYEKKLIHLIKKYCTEKKLNFKIIVKRGCHPGFDTDSYRKKINYLNHFGKVYKDFFEIDDSIKLIGNTIKTNNYSRVDEADIVIFESSTLGLEAISRGKKVVACPIKISTLCYKKKK